MKKIIGITGGVGSGKSTVLSILKEDYSADIFIADEVGHEVFHPGTDSFDRIVSHFGFSVLDSSGEISHEVLSGIIFQEESEKAFLNSIVHPYVIGRAREEIELWRRNSESPLFVLETALLFETGCDSLCDEVWGVLTDADVRVRRLMETRGYSEEKCRSIIAGQMSDQFLMDHCDRVVRNDGSEEELKRIVSSFF